MRSFSVAQIKLKLKGKKFHPLQAKPKEGTQIRQVYDLFIQSLGKPIEFMCASVSNKKVITDLRIVYGLDIRRLKQGHLERKSIWVLAGEWFGSLYIDYSSDTEEQMDRLVEARYALQHTERVENILPAGVHHLSKDSIEILERVAEHGRKLAEKHLKHDA